LVAGVVTVVIIAFLSAQIDTYQNRSIIPPNGLPLIDLDATVAAGEMAIVYLPSEVSPTPTLLATPAQKAPVVEEISSATPTARIDSSCDRAMPDWFPYIVRAEDSISSLAAQFGLSVNDIIKANCLTHGQIIEGQKVYLLQNNKSDPLAAKCDTPPNWVSYIVGSGDTLPKLARAHGTNVYRLMKANCLESTNLITGQKIFLPIIPPTLVKPSGDGSYLTP
jgi:LysM repeat protein